MDLFLIIVPVVAFVIGFLSSQAGVSGAFLLLPFQVSVLGFVSPAVNATNFFYNVVAIPSGVYRYWRENRMLWVLAAIIIAGYVPGIYLGSVARVTYLLDPATFKLFIGVVLLYIGLRLLKSAVKAEEKVKKFDEKVKTHKGVKGVTKVEDIGFKKIVFDFWDEKYDFSPLLMFLTSFVIGIIGGAYGVGGGALMSPLLVAVFRLPLHTVAGANLLGTFVASAIGIVSFTSLGYPPDLKLGILLGVGGLTGIYAGARFQKFVPEIKIRLLLSVLILLLAARYITQYWW
ncbi:MAG: sulfite exporter TauE/SafE family protein [Archaeoglobaceae archaeon]